MAFILRRGSRGTKAVLILLALFVAEAHGESWRLFVSPTDPTTSQLTHICARLARAGAAGALPAATSLSRFPSHVFFAAMTRELQSKEDRTPKQAAPANGTDPAGAAASASRGEADAGSAVIGGVIKFLWDWIGPALLSELGSAVANKVKSFLKNRRVDRSCAVVVRDAVQLVRGAHHAAVPKLHAPRLVSLHVCLGKRMVCREMMAFLCCAAQVNDERMTAISALKRQAGSLHAEVKALGKFKTQVAGLNKQIATLKSQVRNRASVPAVEIQRFATLGGHLPSAWAKLHAAVEG